MKISNLFKHTKECLVFKNTNTLQKLTEPKIQYQITEHD